MMKDRYFYIKDINYTICVEPQTRKYMLEMIDYVIENECAGGEENVFGILYKDGTEDVIDEYYDGHKIKRTNIASIVNINSGTTMVYGAFEMNEYGVVSPAFEENIPTEYVKEVDNWEYEE